ncbi:hypothetical protein [Aestuariicoccus sp. MJ-SS9]|uniref:hypothetical protein n=1 Tax=Aestuariicoccus sp. MJ-SS9 TaxID=3079855 RepID=UPI00292DB89E|nr:hypothetical protein [Aestuariicoccus sp. MJ-SS9]
MNFTSSLGFMPKLVLRMCKVSRQNVRGLRVHEVFDDSVSGCSLTGPLAGEYGPSLDLIKAIIKP